MISWLYRIRPSATHDEFKSYDKNKLLRGSFQNEKITPQQLRWLPFDFPKEKTDFVDGLVTIAGAGDASLRNGVAIHIYSINTSMKDRALCNADGDFLFGKNGSLRNF